MMKKFKRRSKKHFAKSAANSRITSYPSGKGTKNYEGRYVKDKSIIELSYGGYYDNGGIVINNAWGDAAGNLLGNAPGSSLLANGDLINKNTPIGQRMQNFAYARIYGVSISLTSSILPHNTPGFGESHFLPLAWGNLPPPSISGSLGDYYNWFRKNETTLRCQLGTQGSFKRYWRFNDKGNNPTLFWTGARLDLSAPLGSWFPTYNFYANSGFTLPTIGGFIIGFNTYNPGDANLQNVYRPYCSVNITYYYDLYQESLAGGLLALPNPIISKHNHYIDEDNNSQHTNNSLNKQFKFKLK